MNCPYCPEVDLRECACIKNNDRIEIVQFIGGG